MDPNYSEEIFDRLFYWIKERFGPTNPHISRKFNRMRCWDKNHLVEFVKIKVEKGTIEVWHRTPYTIEDMALFMIEALKVKLNYRPDYDGKGHFYLDYGYRENL